MVRTKYSTSKAGSIIALLGATIFSVLIILNPIQLSGWQPWTFIALLFLVALDASYGIYVEIDDENLYSVAHFIIFTKTKVSDISSILYKPTWIIGQNRRSLYILGKGSSTALAKLANAAYPIATLREITQKLIKLNPTIQLDDHAKKLIEPVSRKMSA